MSDGLLLAGVNAVAFLLCVLFLSYVVLILVPYLRHQPTPPGDETQLVWHFVVPCLNEQAVIARTLAGLLSTFPTAHVWVIDDASDDDTPAILTVLASGEPRLHVVRRTLPDARSGKGAALNAGWRAIDAAMPAELPRDRVMVGVVDADALLDPAALALISGPSFFGDPTVGAVQILVRVLRDPFRGLDDQPPASVLSRILVRLQDVEFSGPIAAMQQLRRRAGSVAMGGNGQFTRLSVLDQIAAEHGTPWHSALLEDFELGLHVLLVGSRTEYCHDAWVAQEGLPRLRLLLRQRSRWAQGSMQCLRYLREVLSSTRLSHVGALEISYFLFSPWAQLVGGVVYLVTISIAGYYAFTDPGGVATWWSHGAWGIVPLILIFGLAPFVLWGFVYRRRVRPDTSLAVATSLGLLNAVYVYLHQVAAWWAFVRIATARNDWKKTGRFSGQPSRAGGPAAEVTGAFERIQVRAGICQLDRPDAGLFGPLQVVDVAADPWPSVPVPSVPPRRPAPRTVNPSLTGQPWVSAVDRLRSGRPPSTARLERYLQSHYERSPRPTADPDRPVQLDLTIPLDPVAPPRSSDHLMTVSAPQCGSVRS